MTTFLQWTMLDQVMHLISGCGTLQGFLCVRHVLPSLYTHPNVWSSKMFNFFIISSLFDVWLCSPSKTKPLNSFRRLTTYRVKFVIMLHIRTTTCLANCQKCWGGWSLLIVALCAWSWLFPDSVASAAHGVPPERHVCIVCGEVCSSVSVSRILRHSFGNRFLLPICTAVHLLSFICILCLYK